MRTLAAASLTCLLILNGCTWSSMVARLSGKPEPPRANTTAGRAPATASPSSPRTASTTKADPGTRTASAAPEPASDITKSPSLGIPPGEIPSPGECRLWMPDMPPAQQSAPGACSAVQKKVPAGAWVLHRSEEKSNEVAVNVYRSRWPWIVSETRYFDYWTGAFLRVE